jgi:hypothetical protein
MPVEFGLVWNMLYSILVLPHYITLLMQARTATAESLYETQR